MEKVLGIAQVTIIESFRRKDPYVLLILAALIIFGAGLFSRFGTEGLGKFVKDVGYTVTGMLSVLICVVTAARQLPNEIQNRTLYPLLAKPVSRFQVFLGKYLGVGVMASAVVLLFSLELYFLFRVLGIPVNGVFFQAVYLRVLAMWIIAGMTLSLSVYMTQSGNVTVSLLLALAMQTFANTLITVRTDLQGWGLWLVDALYWILPHLELFDLTKREVHNFPAAPLWVLGALTVYAALYSGVFMAAGMQRFRALNL
ncbi:MAG: ABC transporter permease [Candidatus Hydrogenedentes bacterium]|nr:ABC transporter permease [Candidatus Hydrogenedentota bacterium]